MVKNIFLDRDGVVNNVIIRNSKVESPRSIQEFSIRKEFIEFYNQISQKNIKFFVVSNQPDISRNLLSNDELELMNDILISRFNFTEILYCKHDDKDNCLCRKPRPGMINKLVEKYNLNKQESIFIGDGWKDMESGRSAGIRTVFLSQPYNLELSLKADYVVSDLSEIFHLVIRE